jgi:tRNA(Ile)-lysidine synthase
VKDRVSAIRKSPLGSALFVRATAVAREHLKRGARVCVALSGGVDSVVLLDVMQRLAPKLDLQLSAVHVNHQLSPNAASWERFCRALCRRIGIRFASTRVHVARGDSIEKAARVERYRVFARQRADCVALAHHIDDQVETVLLQLLRGAGVKGLSAMPYYRQAEGERRAGKRVKSCSQATVSHHRAPAILRPLLDVPRSDIVAYAELRGLDWIEDESNLDGHYDRNFVRHEVLPLIAGRFPGYRATIARASRHFAETARLLDELAATDCGVTDTALPIAALRGLTPARAKNVLRRYLEANSVALPNSARLEEWVKQMHTARAGNRFIADLGNAELRRAADTLQVVRKHQRPPRDFNRAWSGKSCTALPDLAGTLVAINVRGQGVSAAKLKGRDVVLRLRRGGERLQTDAKRPRRALKNLLQEAKLPPWERETLPLIYVDGELACVPGIGIDCRFGADAGERGIKFCWRPER